METWLKNDGNSPYNYEIIDVAFRVAGTGSLGLKRYVFLMKSLNKEGEQFILVDMKQGSILPCSLFQTKASQPGRIMRCV